MPSYYNGNLKFNELFNIIGVLASISEKMLSQRLLYPVERRINTTINNIIFIFILLNWNDVINKNTLINIRRNSKQGSYRCSKSNTQENQKMPKKSTKNMQRINTMLSSTTPIGRISKNSFNTSKPMWRM